MSTVLICDPIDASAAAKLKAAGLNVIDKSGAKSEIPDVLPQVHGVIIRSATKVNKEFIEKATQLKIVGRSGVGLDNVDLETCKAKGITVVNSPEGPTRTVAELALGLILSCARKVGKINIETKAGKWPKGEKGFEIYGKTLGVIGTGAIGATLSKYAIAMGMSVVGFDVFKNEELAKVEGFRYAESRDEVFKVADVISCHVPLLPATKHMINKDSFAIMKKGVIIINTARGGVIDEDALLEAVKSGQCGGAALDVFENEPVDASRELIQHPLVITTAHVGAQTHEANKRNTEIVCDKLIKHFA